MPKQFNTDLDLQNLGKVTNMVPATQSGEAVEYDQLNTELDAKQGNLTDGSGIKLTGNTLSIDLSTSDVDNSILTITGANNAVLDGNYTRATYSAYLEYLSGTDGDFNLRFGGDFAFFYKDNGNSTWSVVGANDTDGNANSNNQWYGVVTSINPETVSGDVLNYIVDSNEGVGGIQDQYTNSHDLDEAGKRVPTASDNNISYGAGASDSYLAFDSGKLKVDVVTDTASATTTNILAASTTVTAISEAESRASTASNTSFSNTIANISGNPTNVQAMGEALEDEIDALDSTVQGLSTTSSTTVSRQSSLATAVGVALGSTDAGTWSGGGAAFLTDNSTLKEGVEGAANGAAVALSTLGTVLGLQQGDTDFGGGFTILPNDEHAKALFQAIEVELQTLASGAGATWTAGVVESVHETNISDLNNPATNTFGGEVLSQGDVFLAVGQTNQEENGFYVFDTSSTALVRWTEADATSDFIQNRSVQIVSNGTEWAYKGSADPVVDTDNLPFEKIRESIIADLSVSRSKLSSSVTTELDAKTDKHGEVITLVADTWYQVTHNLDTLFVSVSTYLDSTGIEETYEVRIDNGNQVSIRGTQAEDVRVVIIG